MMPERERERGKAEEGAECPRCERSARSGCVSTCDPLAQGSEGTSSAPPPSTSCWSPPPPTPLQPAPSTAPAATPASASASATARSSVDADLELYALQTHLTPEELQMLALLEMSGPLLRSECARCRLKAQQGAEQAQAQSEKDAGPPCICQTLADDYFFRDARAALARQLRELARRRMAAASVSSLTSGDRVTGETFTTSSGDGCTRVPNRSESEFGDEWDWLTQMQACVPSPPAARDAMNGQPPPQQMGSRPQFMAPRPPSEPVAPGSPGGWGGYSGSTHALHGGPFGGPQNFQSQQPFGQPFSPPPQQPPPPPFGMGGTFGQVPGQTSFSAPSPGQGATYGQTPGQGGAGYGQAPGQSSYGQPPGQGNAFGQQAPGQAGSYSTAGQGAGFGQSPGQGPSFGQSPGQGAGFGQPGQGGAYGQLGSGQTGQYLAQDPYMGGQFTANQYTGMTVQTGYSGPPGYGATQPYAGGAQQQYPQAQFLPAQFQPAQFPGAPNQCTFAVQPPLQQFLSQQGPCGVPAFLPAAGQLCPHLLCGAQVCTGHPCAAPAPPAPPSPPPPAALQQYSEVTAKAQVEGASAAALLRRMTSTLPRQDAGEAATLGAASASASTAGAGAGAGAATGCACSPLELSLKCCWRTPEGALAACERVITCTPRPPRPASAPANCLCLGVAVRDRRLVLWPHGAPAAPAAPPCGTCETSPPAPAPAAPAPAPAPAPPAAPPPPPPPPPLPPPPAGMGAGAVRAGSVLPPPVTLNIGPWMP